MSKKTVVLFKKGGGGRIFKNPENLEEIQKQGKILINPTIPKGVPPHLWKLNNNEILPKGKRRKLEEVLEPQNGGFNWILALIAVSLSVLIGLLLYPVLSPYIVKFLPFPFNA